MTPKKWSYSGPDADSVAFKYGVLAGSALVSYDRQTFLRWDLYSLSSQVCSGGAYVQPTHAGSLLSMWRKISLYTICCVLNEEKQCKDIFAFLHSLAKKDEVANADGDMSW